MLSIARPLQHRIWTQAPTSGEISPPPREQPAAAARGKKLLPPSSYQIGKHSGYHSPVGRPYRDHEKTLPAGRTRILLRRLLTRKSETLTNDHLPRGRTLYPR